MMTYYRKSLKKQYTREELIAYLQRRAKVHGHTPTIGEINKDKDGPGLDCIRKEFSSYEDAIEAAGLEPLPVKWSNLADDELIRAVQVWSAKHDGAKISCFILKNSGNELPSRYLIIQRFSSVKNFFELVNVPYEYTEHSAWCK